MSHIIVNQIRRLPIKNPAKAVLWVIADIADDKGYAYPSIDTIAEETGCSRSTVIRAIAMLESCCVVVANRENGRHTTYTVTPKSYSNQCQSDTGVRVTPVSERHGGGVRVTRGGCQSDTIPVSERHTNPHKPSINPQLTPSVYAHEKIEAVEQVEQPATTKEPKAEKVGITTKVMITSLPELSETVARDFLAYRKAKKAPLTETAWNRIVTEITKAAAHGYSPDDALAEAMVANWQSVKADWLANRNKSKTQQVSQSSWQQQQDEKWGGFFSESENPRPKTVNPDNVISFGALRHG